MNIEYLYSGYPSLNGTLPVNYAFRHRCRFLAMIFQEVCILLQLQRLVCLSEIMGSIAWYNPQWSCLHSEFVAYPLPLAFWSTCQAVSRCTSTKVFISYCLRLDYPDIIMQTCIDDSLELLNIRDG